MSRINRVGWVAIWACMAGAVSQGQAYAQGEAPRPVRVSVMRVAGENLPMLRQLGITAHRDLDYGGFHWLEVSEEDAARLALEGVPFEEVKGAGEVHVGGYHFDPLVQRESRVPSRLARGDSDLRLIQFHGPARKEWLQDLEAQGIQVLQYYPHNTYLVKGSAAQAATAKAMPFTRWQGPFHPAYKVEPALAERNGLIQNVDVMFHNDGRIAETLDALRNIGARVLRYFPSQPDKTFYNAILELDAGAVEAVAKLPGVIWLGYQSPKPVLTDEMSDQIVAGNVSNGIPAPGYRSFLSGLGYDGSGVTWAIVDTGVDWDHPDLGSHVVGGHDFAGACADPGQPGTDCGGHGTHVAGIVAGDAATGHTDTGGFLYGLGVAPGAGLFAMNSLSAGWWPPSGGWQEHSKRAVLGGAVGGNNSWHTGEGAPYGYTTSERTHDIMVRDGNFDTAAVAEPFIEVFAAGNSGPNNTVRGHPAEAKNIIVVASSDNFRVGDPYAITDFSTRGPAVDGRLLPTIAAPGKQIASARNDRGGACSTPIEGTDGSYAFCSGTSMAAPHVSGALAVITQWWRATQGGAHPSPAMAKALLVNSARPTGTTPIPNNAEGWGLLNLDGAIAADSPRLFFDQTTLLSTTGTSHDIAVTVADPSKPLKVTLVWTDAPGAAGANPALVNDLDLIVSNDNDTYRGNVFANGWSVTGGDADNRNNVENVFIQNPGSSAVVSVRASSLNGDGVPYNGMPIDQDFALVCSNCVVGAAPTFNVVVTPSRQTLCQSGVATYDVAVNSLGGFNAPVSLSVSGHPTGTSASFSINPLATTGVSTLTISNTSSTPTGTYALLVTGSAGASSASGGAELSVSATTPSASALIAPADGVTTPSTLSYSWTAVAGTTHYTLQVASDAGFANIVYTAADLTEISHRSSKRLAPGAYYWRVRAGTACGFADSNVQSFTTQNWIGGYVRDASTGSPLVGVDLIISDEMGSGVTSWPTDATGYYYSDDISPGTYYVETNNSLGYLDELYDDLPRVGGSVARGRPITVVIATPADQINFALDRGGRIAGTVTDAVTHAPLTNVKVEIYDSIGRSATLAYTDSSGAYASYAGLPTGSYYATTSNRQGYLDEQYDDVPCPGGTCAKTGGIAVTVTCPITTAGIDFALDPGGRISGRVSSAAGLPLAGVAVYFLDSAGSSMGYVYTDSAGLYSSSKALAGLSTGTYYARTSNSQGYIDEQYGNIPCPGGTCARASGTPISVTSQMATSGIDFTLDPGGRISGTVTGTAGSPLRNVQVELIDSAGRTIGYAYSDSSGYYKPGVGLPTGTYYARTANNQGYVDELYDNIPCPASSCSSTGGTPISVFAPNTATGINFTLEPGGRISGAVTGTAGSPLRDVRVELFDSAGRGVGYAYTDDSGRYETIFGLPSGTYYAKTASASGFLPELYNNLPCSWQSCVVISGTAISVSAPNTTSGINFTLDRGGRVSGRVTSASGAPLGGFGVYFFNSTDSAGRYLVASGVTDGAGLYTSSVLPTGTYYARTTNVLGFIDKLYDNVPCPGGSCRHTTGTPISVTAPNTTPGIDFVLDPGGRISGRVTSASGSPLANVSLPVLDSRGYSIGFGYTDGAGLYASSGLPTGTYYVMTNNSQGFLDELYNNIPCRGGMCVKTSGAPISVTLPSTTAGVDFVLDRAEAVIWTNVVGVTALGNSLTKTAASGWGNAGASSVQALRGDGFVEVLAWETTTSRMFGLSGGDTNQDYRDIDFAMYLTGSSLKVYERGAQRVGSSVTCLAGDLLRVAVVGGVVKYSRNGVVFYTSTVAPTYPLLVDTALYDAGATIIDAVISAPPGPPGPPVPVITGPTSGRIGTPLTFDGSGSWDPDGSVTSYVWDFGDGTSASGATVTHAYSSVGAFNVTLTVADDSNNAVTSPARTVTIAQPVFWKSVVGVTATGNNLTKTAAGGWGNAGAVSTRAVPSGDGYVEIVASETTTNRMFGLSNGDTNQDYRDIDYAMLLANDGNLYVYERGARRGGGGFTTYVPDDRLRVEVVGGAVKYSKNGAVFYTSTVAPTYPLLVDTALYDTGATVKDAVLFAQPGPPVPVISGPTSGTVATPLAFDGSGSWDPDGSVMSYVWDFGEGEPVAGPTGTHAFSAGGSYTVALTVTDNDGLAATATQVVTIVDDNLLPTVSIGDASVVEGATGATANAVFTISLSAPAEQPITVVARTVDGTALSGSDYAAKGVTKTFAPGVTTQTVTVVVNGDAEVEADETFLVNLSSPSPAEVTIVRAQAAGTIQSDDVGMSVADVSVTEGDSGTTSAVFTVSLLAPNSLPISVSYATVDGTALAGSDYTAVSGTLTFAPREDTTRSVTVPILGETTNEADETFRLKLTGPVNAVLTRGQAQGTIVNDDPLPTLSIGDVAVVEGAAGTAANAVFTISLSAPAGQPITVVASTTDGTALSGSDYGAKGVTKTFAPGVTTQTVTVVVNGDAEVEGDETFLVNLSNPSPAEVTIVRAQAVGTIQSDDVGVSLADVSVTEGDSGTTSVVFTVSLSAPNSLPISVSYTTVDGTALAGSDYTAVSGALTFAPREDTTKSVTVPILGETTNEADETFRLKLTGPVNAVLTRGQAQGTIVNDDPLPTLSVGDVTVVEGAAGTTVNAVFTISLSVPAGQPITVVASTVDGTALSGSDYAAKGVTKTFAPGVTTQTVTVVVNGDALIEPNETFCVNLSSPVGATLGRGQGIGAIVNDDPALK